eukprot:SAG22_NODE_65_length_23128_cov_51.766609_1_plen_539_part_00
MVLLTAAPDRTIVPYPWCKKRGPPLPGEAARQRGGWAWRNTDGGKEAMNAQRKAQRDHYCSAKLAPPKAREGSERPSRGERLTRYKIERRAARTPVQEQYGALVDELLQAGCSVSVWSGAAGEWKRRWIEVVEQPQPRGKLKFAPVSKGALPALAVVCRFSRQSAKEVWRCNLRWGVQISKLAPRAGSPQPIPASDGAAEALVSDLLLALGPAATRIGRPGALEQLRPDIEPAVTKRGLVWEAVAPTLAKLKSLDHLHTVLVEEAADKKKVIDSLGRVPFKIGAFLIPEIDEALESARPVDSRWHFELLDPEGAAAGEPPKLIAVADGVSGESKRQLARFHRCLARAMEASKLGSPVELAEPAEPDSYYGGDDDFESGSDDDGGGGGGSGRKAAGGSQAAASEAATAASAAAAAAVGSDGPGKPALKTDPYGYDENHPSFYQPPPISFYAAAADVRERISALQGPPSVQGQSITKATGEFIRWQSGLTRGLVDEKERDRSMDIGAGYWSTMEKSAAGQRKARLIKGLAYPPDIYRPDD